MRIWLANFNLSKTRVSRQKIHVDGINGTHSGLQTAGLVFDKAETARSATATRRECLITTPG